MNSTYRNEEILRAEEVFRNAPVEPAWLTRDVLEILQSKYEPPPAYGYDPQSILMRGAKRAEKIVKTVRKEAGEGIQVNRILELGCMDGMTSCVLKRMGFSTTAIDRDASRFDEKAIFEGVEMKQMDAEILSFEDNTFDFVFSYNSFEHFTNPELAFKEAVRVVREGGYIYLDFGPLYMSPLGLHVYRSITVPYCHLLFQKEVLRKYAEDNGLAGVDLESVNGWSLENYHEMWAGYSDRLKTLYYYESINTSHLDLIMKYPSCFKSKTDCFENMLVEDIKALFLKLS